MSQAALEQEFSLRQSFNTLLHSDSFRAISMAGAVTLAAIGCGGAPGTTVKVEQPGTTLEGGHGTTPDHGTTLGTAIAVSPDHQTLVVSATTPPGPGIRGVDFSNFDLDPTACENSAVTWPTHLQAGRATAKDGSDRVTVSIIDQIAYGDVNGDGKEEAVVALECEPGTAAITYPLNVYTMKDGRAQLLGIVGHNSGVTQYILKAKPNTFKVSDEKVVIDGAYFNKGDTAYNPTGQATTKWGWAGSNFVLESAEVHNPAGTDSMTTMTTEVPAVGGEVQKIVSIKGVGDIQLGMSRQAISDLGYTVNQACGSLVQITRGNVNLSAILDNNNDVSQIEVTDPNIETLSGAGVNTTVDELRNIYKNKGTLTGIKANGVNFLAYKSTAPEDANNWLLFGISGDNLVKWMVIAPTGQGSGITDC